MKARLSIHVSARGSLRLIFLSFVWLLPMHALSRTFVEPEPQVSYARATDVVEVRIAKERKIASSNQPCGSTYEAIVLSSAKGSIGKGALMTFGFLGGLEEGMTYKLYLLSNAPRSAWADMVASRMPADENLDAWLDKCLNFHPTKTIFFRSIRIKEVQ